MNAANPEYMSPDCLLRPGNTNCGGCGMSAGLTMLGAQSDTQIRLTVRHALEAGATKEEIAETIAQMSMFAGIPSMTRAMDFAREILDDSEEKGKDK